MTEVETIAFLTDQSKIYAVSSMGSAYGGIDASIAYQAGLRQGTYNGLVRAATLIKEELQKKDDKEKDL